MGRYGSRPIALCRRCAFELPERSAGCTYTWVAPIPLRITAAAVKVALKALEDGAGLPTEPCRADLTERADRLKKGEAHPEPPWMDAWADLPGDEWKRGH